MTEQTIPSKAEIISRLRDSGAEAVEKLRAMDPGSFEEGRYENGWNARQILAHVASIEWSYPKLIDVARAAASPPPPAQNEEPRQPRPAGGGINDYNARQVEKRADASAAELIDEFETNRAATIAAFEALDEDLFSVPIRSAGGAQGPLAMVLRYVAIEHVNQHIKDIAG
jgi:hypothetical protein